MTFAFRRSCAAVAAVGLLSIGSAAGAVEPSTSAGGSRIVGVASICRPRGASMKQMEAWIDEAALDKPDIILLTEACMSNAPGSATTDEKNAAAEPLPKPGPITEFLARKAKQHNAYIFGCYYRKAPGGKGRYNSAVLLDRQGKLAGCYDKVYPTIGEIEGGVVPGDEAKVFDTDFGRIGAVICYDLNFPELIEQYKEKGTELLCFLSAYRGGLRVPAIAYGNQCFVASAVPNENGVIVDPMGRTLAESSQYDHIAFAKINLESQVVHIDYNVDKVRAMKQKYGPAVSIETFSPDAVYFVSSLDPQVPVQTMLDEFGIVSRNAYLDRARAVRRSYLGED